MTSPVLTSRSARVAGARRLVERKHRRAEGRFLVEGPQAVREALLAGCLVEVFVSTEATGPATVVAHEAGRAGVPLVSCDDKALASLCGSVTPQGVVGVARLVTVSPAQALAADLNLVVLLDEVSDPGNAGTVIRVADAAGADAVVLSPGSVDVHNDKCVRATTGSLFHVPVCADADLVSTAISLRQRGVRVLGTSGAATETLDDLADAGLLAGPTAWVLGNEAHGLSDAVAAACDSLVRIPIHGQAESLNLATAAAVVLYASAREQRRGR